MLKMKSLFRSKRFRVVAVLLVVIVHIVGVLVWIGLAEPRSSLGHIVFHTGYAFPPTRPAFLNVYQWSLAEFEGGHLPSSIDTFLIDRLADCKGSHEETAIIDFQVRQGSGGWGESASRSHETYQGQIIANILPRLDDLSDWDAVSALLLVESLRREDSLGKGGFSGMWTYSGGDSSLNRPAFEAAKARFQAWWGDGSGWPATRSVDPLEGTELEVYNP